VKLLLAGRGGKGWMRLEVTSVVWDLLLGDLRLEVLLGLPNLLPS
jgi:hypothetical protein